MLANPPEGIRLLRGSACIDAGTRLDLDRDFFGMPVPFGLATDIGPYEMNRTTTPGR